jgi:AraC-like DNA-binding protein
MKIVGVGVGIPAVVEALGGNLAALCAEAGLDPGIFSDHRNVLPVDAFGRLLHLAARQLSSPCFGLLVGARTEVYALGVLGETMRVCDTLRDALRVLDAHFQLNTRGMRIRFDDDRDAGYLTFGMYEPLLLGVAQSIDVAVAAAVQVVRKICCSEIVPLEVGLPRRAPSDIEPYHALFRCPVRFNAAEAVVSLRPESLRRRLPGAQPAVRAALERSIRRRESVSPLDFEEEVRRALRPEIVGARSFSDTVAERFDIDRRTMNRRLRPSGRSFKGVAEDLRDIVARQLLDDTNLQLGEIAAALDFAEPASFTRAFQRWSGMAPGAWRDRPPDLRPASPPSSPSNARPAPSAGTVPNVEPSRPKAVDRHRREPHTIQPNKIRIDVPFGQTGRDKEAL